MPFSNFARALTMSVIATLAFTVAPSVAQATTTTQLVSGSAVGSIALAVGAPAPFVGGFQAGSTATTTGILTVTDTSPHWTLSVEDAATGDPGHLVAGSSGCAGSEANLQNPLSVSVTSLLGGVTSAGAVSISGAPHTVASATNQLLAANVFTTNYSQTIGSSEVLLSGCAYSLTATYTLQ